MGRKRSLVFGMGFNTSEDMTSYGGKRTFEYVTWANMLKRCYNVASLKVNDTYQDKYVCSEWLDFKNFNYWLKGYEYRKEGWELDKDLLIKNNKVYGPETCVFLPRRINCVLLKCDKARGDLPVGVHFDKARLRYKATCCNEHGKQWQKRFDTIEEAFSAYKVEKERVLKTLAEMFKDEIDPRAYKALINYQVEITD